MLLTTTYLAALAGHHNGIIPQPMDMNDDQKEALMKEALSNPDDRDQLHDILIEFVDDNGFAGLFDPDPEEAKRITMNNLYAALESDLVDDIDDHNGDCDNRPVTLEQQFTNDEDRMMESCRDAC